MLGHWRIGLAVAFATGLALPTGASADAQVGGTVTAGGSPVAGVFVAIVGTNGRYAAITDASGSYTAPAVATGTDYTVSAQAEGYLVAQAAGVAVNGSPVVQDFTLTPSGTKFEALGVYGGQISNVLADGSTGVFYAATSVIPQLYRTADYGGSWAPVTLGADDPNHGLPGDTNIFNRDAVTTSGFPGEVAAMVGSAIYYTTDFGVTWTQVAGNVAGGSRVLYWGHAGTTSVLLAVDLTTGQVERADMTAATPTLATMTGSFLASPADRMAVANGADAPYVASVSDGGTLTIYGLNATDDPPTVVGTPLAGVLSHPALVAFGGAKASGAPPAAVLVYSATSDSARMATKTPGAASFVSGDLSAETSVAGCGASAGNGVGSVSPLGSGTDGTGTVAQCFLQKSGTAALTVNQVAGINNNTGLAFDAEFGSAGGAVMLSGDGERGVVKSASAPGGVPSFPSAEDAGAGTGATSGGSAVNGFNVPVVKDSAFGSSASQLATIFSGSGGARGVASADGGTTFVVALARGGRAVDWWEGTANEWLVFGTGMGGNLLAAIADWTPATPPLGQPNVAGTSGPEIGSGPQSEVTALAGVPGADALFIGTGEGVDQMGTVGAVKRAQLAPGNPPTIGSVTDLAAGTIGAPVRALAYCPMADSAGSIADALLVATGTGGGGSETGGLVRVTDATTAASPSASAVTGLSGAPVNDVRAHCGSGTVYAGVGTNTGGPSGGLYKSTDGGLTFAAVAVTGANFPPGLNVQALAVNPGDEDEVLIAGNSEGFLLRSTDGGTTWTMVNDPRAPGGRNFLSEGVGDLQIPPPAGISLGTGPAVTTSVALVGTGGGLFAASVRGTLGQPCASDADCVAEAECSDALCGDGICIEAPKDGLEAADCELDGFSDLCGDGELHKKLARLLAKKVKQVRRLLGKVGKAKKAKKAAKLMKRADNVLKKLRRKAAKGKSSADCKAAVQAQIDVVRERIADAQS